MPASCRASVVPPSSSTGVLSSPSAATLWSADVVSSRVSTDALFGRSCRHPARARPLRCARPPADAPHGPADGAPRGPGPWPAAIATAAPKRGGDPTTRGWKTTTTAPAATPLQVALMWNQHSRTDRGRYRVTVRVLHPEPDEPPLFRFLGPSRPTEAWDRMTCLLVAREGGWRPRCSSARYAHDVVGGRDPAAPQGSRRRSCRRAVSAPLGQGGRIMTILDRRTLR